MYVGTCRQFVPRSSSDSIHLRTRAAELACQAVKYACKKIVGRLENPIATLFMKTAADTFEGKKFDEMTVRGTTIWPPVRTF